MALRVPERLRRRFDAFLDRRLPPASSQELSHKSIFIFPSGFGFAWLGLVLLLYLFGTNYQNNLVIGLALVLLSLFLSCIIYSFRNLAGLNLSRLPPPHIYAGETLALPMELTSSHGAMAVNLSYPGNEVVVCDCGKEPQKVLVPVKTRKRGLLRPGRLLVESRYPLGLLRTWSWLDMDVAHPVFASPLPAPVHLGADSDASSSSDLGKHVAGVDEFAGLRSYVQGESLQRVAWKQLAQGRGMLSKDFAEPQGLPQWLALPTNEPLETALSQLAWQVDELTRSKQIFGLRLGDTVLEPALGEQHRIGCQLTIALYPERP
ncbi:DUF58 domain-containing protein [Shewanella cyperi]|uniref:DUF58 domain-containing protein n=1 Tax=Shewanella cyperi TaxID=2814292 RepID=A0A974XND0_9GAMM|nr:DUF58 domain-containing protein [Shewanella cyperi]QSX31564.1 DUF58 domain-containing protein [Shewanella cyperi]